MAERYNRVIHVCLFFVNAHIPGRDTQGKLVAGEGGPSLGMLECLVAGKSQNNRKPLLWMLACCKGKEQKESRLSLGPWQWIRAPGMWNITSLWGMGLSCVDSATLLLKGDGLYLNSFIWRTRRSTLPGTTVSTKTECLRILNKSFLSPFFSRYNVITMFVILALIDNVRVLTFANVKFSKWDRIEIETKWKITWSWHQRESQGIKCWGSALWAQWIRDISVWTKVLN